MEPSVHDAVDEQLRRTRQRYTPGRRELVVTLLAADRPLTIGELLERDVSQSQSSLYRNLAVLERCGVVHRLATTDEGARFELAEGLSHHHHHLTCTRCGRMEDFTLPAAVETALHAAAVRAEEVHGFRAQEHRVELVGVCAACA
jgi:Fur family transcriptional regulator, ferric uptake regulator